ncbi:MAG: choice-of-anchor protein [Chitinophagaceae bacterium]|nr:choice-of-anchor protein [Chitinophagaceae bacterium]
MKKQLLTLAALFAITTGASAQTFVNGSQSYVLSYVTGDANQTCYANFAGSNGGIAFGGGNVNSVAFAHDAVTPIPNYSAMTWTGKATAPDFNTVAPYYMFLSEVVGTGPSATCANMSDQAAIPSGYDAINMTTQSKVQFTAKSSVNGTVLRFSLAYAENAYPAITSFSDLAAPVTVTLSDTYATYTLDFSAWANRGAVNMYGFIIENAGSPVISITELRFGGSVITANNNANVVNDQVSLYPNPSKGSFNVDMTSMNNSDAASVKIMNANGLVVKEFTTTNAVELVSTESMNKGIYMVQITSGNKIATKKVVVD